MVRKSYLLLVLVAFICILSVVFCFKLKSGNDGNGIYDSNVASNGHLLLYYTDGRVVDAGNVVGEMGPKGETGRDGSSPPVEMSIWVERWQNPYFLINTPLDNGAPVIWKGDRFIIQGAGFQPGESVIIYVEEEDSSWIKVGSINVVTNGVIYTNILADWPFISVLPPAGTKSSESFSSIKAVGSKGSLAYEFVMLGH